MKTVMILGDKASELLVDGLEPKNGEEFVFSEYAIADLARKLDIPPLKDLEENPETRRGEACPGRAVDFIIQRGSLRSRGNLSPQHIETGDVANRTKP